jgi:hypothetical protein
MVGIHGGGAKSINGGSEGRAAETLPPPKGAGHTRVQSRRERGSAILALLQSLDRNYCGMPPEGEAPEKTPSE